jgi:hypothetical protein
MVSATSQTIKTYTVRIIAKRRKIYNHNKPNPFELSVTNPAQKIATIRE